MVITAKVKTLLKKHNKDSSELPPEKLQQVAVGQQFTVNEILSREGNAEKVRLDDGADWWIFAPHWNGLPTDLLLSTPYYSQRDNYRDSWRTCFSSSCAMLVATIKPGVLARTKGDDAYVREVFKRGDTVEAGVQLSTLSHFGVSARFSQSMNFSDLDSQLSKGIPIPIGILHHGPPGQPSGGGHYVCVIGRKTDGSGYIVHDPWGEIDHASGTYPSTDGERLNYSKNLLTSRWTVGGGNTGWGIIASKA